MVTGGAGFIGSHVVEQLLARGDEVIVLDDFSTGLEENLRAAAGSGDSRLRTYRVDIADDTAAAIVRQETPDVLLLIAAQSSVKVSMRDPMEDARVNVIGMLNMLEAARASACRKVVFASSGGTIYGSVDEDQLPLREDYPTAPVSFYGLTKAALGHFRPSTECRPASTRPHWHWVTSTGHANPRTERPGWYRSLPATSSPVAPA